MPELRAALTYERTPARQRNCRRRLWAALLFTSTVAAACGGTSEADGTRVRFSTGDGEVVASPVEVPTTAAEFQRGLMGRRTLDPIGGMLFMFKEPSRTAFWMKGTLIPLSIAFWDGRGRIVDILDMEPCTKDPCPTYTPSADYVAALEMRKGYFREHGIRVGDHAEVELDE